MNFDVIIPVSTKDAFFVHRTVSYIKRNVIGVQNVYIISKKNNMHFFKQSLADENVFFIDENNLLKDLSYNNVRQVLSDKDASKLTGWFFQQFLKMAFARSEYAKDFYMSWDSDTLPLRRISFEKNNKPVFDKKKEYHKPYFSTITRLLGLEKSVDFSFIAEHMLFKTSIMLDLLHHIEEKNASSCWWKSIINSCAFDESLNCFSEFETYGTFCFSRYPDDYEVCQLASFRHGGMICGRFISDNRLKQLAFDLDTISFEMRDVPPFPLSVVHRGYDLFLKIISKLDK